MDTSVSKKFPTLASPRLYLVVFFQIYGCNNTIVNVLVIEFLYRIDTFFNSILFYKFNSANQI